MRIEAPLLTFFTIVWGVVLLDAWSIVHLGGRANFGLYLTYGIAGTLGWLAGNAFVIRRAQGEGDRLAIATWLGGPPSLFFLLWAFNPVSVRHQLPLVPLWATCVFVIFFAVPATLMRRR